MREDLLRELEAEYAEQRSRNEREEAERKEKIRTGYPEIRDLVRRREELVFGAIRNILDRKENAGDLTESMEQLNAQIREKLREAGFPPDYLAPVCRCPVCMDQGKTGDLIKEPCACFRKAYQRKLREKIGLSGEKTETFETFDLNRFSDEPLPGHPYSQRQLMEVRRKTCEEWADRYPDTECRDLLLTGQSGLGKTFLLHAMAERLISRDVNVLLISAYRMLELLRRAYFSGEDADRELRDAEVLMIDDLGSEPMMQNLTVEQLFNLLNERRDRGLSTVISTNLQVAEIQRRYTERIASRLRDRRFCRIMTLEGNDIRV